jgi:hypothetical protein
MRTTLVIEDQLAKDLERIATESRRSLKSVLNEVIRLGLEVKRLEARDGSEVFREMPVAMGLRREYEGKLNQLMDELEVEGFMKQ